MRGVGGLPAGLGLRIRERRIGARGDVAHGADRIRRLVVAHQDDGAPAAGRRLRLDGHEEVEQWPHLGTAVHVIPGLDQGGVAARPPALGIDQPHTREDPQKRVEVTVDVRDRNHPAGCRTRPGRGGRRSKGQRRGNRGGNDGPRSDSACAGRSGLRAAAHIQGRSKRGSYSTTRFQSAGEATLSCTVTRNRGAEYDLDPTSTCKPRMREQPEGFR